MPRDITAKSILNKTRRRDPWFLDDYTINPYSGCTFNCLYCYTRGGRYGQHMEEKASVKSNAPELLEVQLKKRSAAGQHGMIVLSSATDAYLHFEKELGLTRRILELILKYRFPVHVITKSDLVIRDLDLLQEIGEKAILPPGLEGKMKRKAVLTFSFSTVDDQIASIFEPGATAPTARLKTLKAASDAGLLAGVSMMPMLPYISDTGDHLREMFRSFSAAGAQYVLPATITLFGSSSEDSKTLVLRAVEKHYPRLMEKYRQLFGNSHELPAYYRAAFSKKCDELSAEFRIRASIINQG